ncbi:MAG: protein kinase, partial [Haliangium ochraceum]
MLAKFRALPNRKPQPVMSGFGNSRCVFLLVGTADLVRHACCKTMALERGSHMTPQTLDIANRSSFEPPPPPPQELPPGTVLHDTYRLLHAVAEGGCGTVYAAAHARLPGQFAVKVLHRGLIRNLEAMTRFRQEAEITSTLRHPHIVQVLDFNVTPDGSPYFVMELLEGRPLATVLAERGAIEPAAAVHIVEQIAQALYAAHLRGIVHRDLKPDNVVLLSGQGMPDFVKVLDFGISQASWRPRLTDNTHVAGTPQYMAPEQACGLRDEIGPWTDQFSLAAITYTLLTGQEPFTAEDAIAVLYQVVHSDPPLPSHHTRLGAAVDATIMRGLAKKPVDRFPDVLAFAESLRAALFATPVTPVATAPAPEPEIPAGVAQARPVAAQHAPVGPVRAFDAPRPVPPEPPPVPAPGRQTVRLIRKVRRRIHRGPRTLALLAVAATATVLYFSPTART